MDFIKDFNAKTLRADVILSLPDGNLATMDDSERVYKDESYAMILMSAPASTPVRGRDNTYSDAYGIEHEAELISLDSRFECPTNLKGKLSARKLDPKDKYGKQVLFGEIIGIDEIPNPWPRRGTSEYFNYQYVYVYRYDYQYNYALVMQNG